MTDITATIINDTTVYPDGKPFLVHAGETYAIDRLGTGGVYVLTPFGEAFLGWRQFSWSESALVMAPSGLMEVAG